MPITLPELVTIGKRMFGLSDVFIPNSFFTRSGEGQQMKSFQNARNTLAEYQSSAYGILNWNYDNGGTHWYAYYRIPGGSPGGGGGKVYVYDSLGKYPDKEIEYLAGKSGDTIVFVAGSQSSSPYDFDDLCGFFSLYWIHKCKETGTIQGDIVEESMNYISSLQ
jgi:hypothetical protein